MPKDLRTYLDQLVERDPSSVRVVDREVDPVFGATAIVDKMEGDPAYPAGSPAGRRGRPPRGVNDASRGTAGAP
jgi:hypothetical protein